jgi:two-component system CheB/CheR fusion protein
MSSPEQGRPSRRVLVVEDNPDSRQTLCLLLSLWGFQVEQAEDGEEGLRKALEWRPEAAVVDIGLPRLDGYEMARQVRQGLGEPILLIALTGYNQPGDRQRSFEAGFNHHLAKPADLAELSRLLAGA